MRHIRLLAMAILAVLLTSGCGKYGSYSFGMRRETSGRNHWTVTYKNFNGMYARVVKAKEVSTLRVSFTLVSQRGDVSLEIEQPDGRTIPIATCKSGTKSGTWETDVSAKQKCHLIFKGKNTAGSFSAKWTLE